MPRRAATPCRSPGCPGLVQAGRCRVQRWDGLASQRVDVQRQSAHAWVTVRAGGGDGYAIYVQIHYALTRSAPTVAHRCQLPMSITS